MKNITQGRIEMKNITQGKIEMKNNSKKTLRKYD